MSGLMTRTQWLIHRQGMAIKVYLEIRFQNKNIHCHTDSTTVNSSRLENWASPCMIIIRIIVILPKVLSSRFYN